MEEKIYRNYIYATCTNIYINLMNLTQLWVDPDCIITKLQGIVCGPEKIAAL